MRIFVAGATGAVGRAMTPQLLSAGHDVTAITRDASKAAALERQGVHAVVCDVFDTDALIEAVRHAAPEAVIHQLTRTGFHFCSRGNRRRVICTIALSRAYQKHQVAGAFAPHAIARLASRGGARDIPAGERGSTVEK